MENISLLTYTNSKCSDIQKLYFDSIKLYFPIENHFVLSDNEINESSITLIKYDNNSKYYEQILHSLDKIKTDYVIYSQEDYVLYDYVNVDKINQYIEILNKDDKLMFIRLIISGIDGDEESYNDELMIVKNYHDYYFSTQITIWKKEHLKKMFELSKVESVFDEPKNSPFLKSLNKVGLCTKLLGDKIGSHFNSVIYPYIATAIVKGKWNFSEYESILLDLFKKYNIDYNIKGVR